MNLSVLLTELVAFSFIASLYIGYKKRNNFLGFGVFIACMVIVGFMAYWAKSQLINDFPANAGASMIIKPVAPAEKDELQTVKKWIEWHKRMNKETGKKGRIIEWRNVRPDTKV